jgi:hypothetical protein
MYCRFGVIHVVVVVVHIDLALNFLLRDWVKCATGGHDLANQVALFCSNQSDLVITISANHVTR